ncbi:hypothetical protein GCHA_4064 [Paraglaciecola chathamensis S18K6]|uniref:Uncharacterized protein n=1 Tax=Paraglaciecola chathamensis S18K6 TaxID=1127672 RepID=A0AAV3V5L7_9ALTE|nr:hypothetical protein GCHA_4064 [Paraglaciecola chathamensis S18K6]
MITQENYVRKISEFLVCAANAGFNADTLKDANGLHELD